jgi:hypothetical protein
MVAGVGRVKMIGRTSSILIRFLRMPMGIKGKNQPCGTEQFSLTVSSFLKHGGEGQELCSPQAVFHRLTDSSSLIMRRLKFLIFRFFFRHSFPDVY